MSVWISRFIAECEQRSWRSTGNSAPRGSTSSARSEPGRAMSQRGRGRQPPSAVNNNLGTVGFDRVLKCRQRLWQLLHRTWTLSYQECITKASTSKRSKIGNDTQIQPTATGSCSGRPYRAIVRPTTSPSPLSHRQPRALSVHSIQRRTSAKCASAPGEMPSRGLPGHERTSGCHINLRINEDLKQTCDIKIHRFDSTAIDHNRATDNRSAGVSAAVVRRMACSAARAIAARTRRPDVVSSESQRAGQRPSGAETAGQERDVVAHERSSKKIRCGDHRMSTETLTP